MKNAGLVLVAALCVLSPTGAQAKNNLEFMIEAGSVWQNRNDVQIPPDTGTRLQIDQFNEGPFFHYRLESYYRINKRHALRLVYAPSSFELTGQSDRDVEFNGKTFSSTEDLTVRYKFNSYRLSYLYGFWGFGRDQINVGFTAKVRDAKTTFSQGGVSSTYKNVGFVPLLYFEFQKELSENWNLNFTVEAAASAQGRAIDAALKARRIMGEGATLGVGFRSLEGGADNEKVFTFSWFNYALIDFKVNF